LSKSVVKADLISIQVGLPKTINQGEADDSPNPSWTTGFFKNPVQGKIWLSHTNLEGDGQADLHNHGGLEKAINTYPHEHYTYWEQTLGWRKLDAGSFGENFTINGLLESDVCIGDIFDVGEARIQVSQPRQPCWKLSRRWGIHDLALQVQNTGRTGWYFRVLTEGFVEAGTQLVLSERPHPQWSVSLANDIMHQRTSDMEAARSLMECDGLALRWKATLAKRVATGSASSNDARLYGPSPSSS